MTQMPDAALITALLGGALSLICAMLVLVQLSGGSLAGRLALIYFLLSAFWYGGVAFRQAGLGEQFLLFPPNQLIDLGLLVLAVVLLCLTQAALGEQSVKWGWVLFGAIWVVLCVAADLANSLPLENLPFLAGLKALPISSGTIALYIGWTILMAAAAVWTVRAQSQGMPFALKASSWLLGLFLIALGDLSWLSGYAISGQALKILGGVMLAVIVAGMKGAAFNRATIGKQPGVQRALLGVVLLTFSLALVLIAGRAWPHMNPFLLGLIGALVLALILRPGMRKADLSLDERVALPTDEAQNDPTDLLRQYSTSINNTLDPNLLATVAAGTASELLETRRSFLFLVYPEPEQENPERFVLRGIKGMGDLDPPPIRLRRDGLLAELFQRDDRPLTHAQLVQHPSFARIELAERNWLEILGAAVYAPIHSQDSWIGLLALGPKGSGTEYTSQDLAFLSAMAQQTAVALENARLVEGLKRLNEEYRRAYQALEQANLHLERLDKTRADFITIVSHELRTPLNLITSAGQMLLDEPELMDNPYYKQVLDNLNNGVLRLNLIVESLLDMARIDTRQMVLELQPVSIQQVVRMVYDELKEDAAARRQTIEINDLDKMPLVMADLPALRKVFHHLVVNAIKYTPDGGKITVSGRSIPPNGDELPGGGVEVVVSDNGIGIDPIYRDLVFTKFYQMGESALHSSGWTKFRGGGPGLGLSIARGIVEAHQGKIWVESPGYDEERCPGSQFHVLLPLRQVQKPEMRTEQTVL